MLFFSSAYVVWIKTIYTIANDSIHCVQQASLARLSTIRITISHTYLYKKLDEFGKGHDKPFREAVARLCGLCA